MKRRSSGWRIEVSPSTIVAYTLKVTVIRPSQVIDIRSEVLDLRKITLEH